MSFTLSGLLADSYAGSKGEKGDKGELGTKGDIGLTGTKGDKGIDGTIGVNGDKGDTGSKGDTGDKGADGVFGVTLNTFTGNGSNTQFTLSTQPQTEDYTIVVIDGVTQLKNAYTVSGNTITFSAAPSNGSSIDVTVLEGGAKGDTGSAGTKGDKGEQGSTFTTGKAIAMAIVFGG